MNIDIRGLRQVSGTAFRDIKATRLYPAVGMKRLGEHVRVNFGQEEFVWDVNTYMAVGSTACRMLSFTNWLRRRKKPSSTGT